MNSSLWLLMALAISAILPRPVSATPLRPQYVLISFDGAHDIRQWERSRALARQTDARFTYFLSCTFLLSPETASFYRGPGMASGRSNIGFAKSRQEVSERLQHVWSAAQEGHEIANHGCGHFDGKEWSKAQWQAEVQAFSDFFRNAWTLNEIPGEPTGWQELADEEIVGFRAPYLSTSSAMFEALADAGYSYDASTVSPEPADPHEKGGLLRFALPLIPEGPRARQVIAMDYNLYVRHSGGEERPEEAAIFSDRAVKAFMDAFERELSGHRRPLQIGLHFSLMNGGAYWDALERFATNVCTREEVRCISHKDYLGELRAAVPRG